MQVNTNKIMAGLAALFASLQAAASSAENKNAPDVKRLAPTIGTRPLIAKEHDPYPTMHNPCLFNDIECEILLYRLEDVQDRTKLAWQLCVVSNVDSTRGWTAGSQDNGGYITYQQLFDGLEEDNGFKCMIAEEKNDTGATTGRALLHIWSPKSESKWQVPLLPATAAEAMGFGTTLLLQQRRHARRRQHEQEQTAALRSAGMGGVGEAALLKALMSAS